MTVEIDMFCLVISPSIHSWSHAKYYVALNILFIFLFLAWLQNYILLMSLFMSLSYRGFTFSIIAMDLMICFYSSMCCRPCVDETPRGACNTLGPAHGPGPHCRGVGPTYIATHKPFRPRFAQNG